MRNRGALRSAAVPGSAIRLIYRRNDPEHLSMNTPIGDLRPLLAKVAAGERLSESDAEAAFEIIMSGGATPSQIGAFLMGLRVRGETDRKSVV